MLGKLGLGLAAVWLNRTGAAPAIRIALVVGGLTAVADAVVGVPSAEQQVPPLCGPCGTRKKKNSQKATILCNHILAGFSGITPMPEYTEG